MQFWKINSKYAWHLIIIYISLNYYVNISINKNILNKYFMDMCVWGDRVYLKPGLEEVLLNRLRVNYIDYPYVLSKKVTWFIKKAKRLKIHVTCLFNSHVVDWRIIPSNRVRGKLFLVSGVNILNITIYVSVFC